MITDEPFSQEEIKNLLLTLLWNESSCDSKKFLQSNIAQSLLGDEYNIVLYVLCIKLMYRYRQISFKCFNVRTFYCGETLGM